MGARPIGAADRDPVGAMLGRAVLPALVVGAVVTALSAPAGAAAVRGAIVGCMLAVISLSAGPLVFMRFRSASPPAVMAIAVAAYLGTVVVLGVAFLLLAPASWSSSRHVGVALIACTGAWLAGQVRALMRLRVLAFGASPAVGTGPDDPAARGGVPG